MAALTIAAQLTALEPAAIYDNCWRRGQLSWLLEPHEKRLYADFRRFKAPVSVGLCSRGYGKTKVEIVMALEDAIQKGLQFIPFITKDKTKGKDFLSQLMPYVSKTAPQDLRPEWREMGSEFRLPRDSRLKLYGTDREQFDSLRGGTLSGLVFIDEAGFCDNLKEIMLDVLGPALRKGGGRMVLTSTSPYSTDHYFWERVDMAQKDGAFCKYTIEDNLLWSAEKKEEAFREAGGRESTTTRREYFCERIQDARSAVIPEMTDDAMKKIVRVWERPRHYQLYGALDPGTKDGRSYIMGYWDFLAGKMVIDSDASTLEQNTTTDMYRAICKLEKARHGDHAVHARYSDTDLQVIIDLNREHGLQIWGTAKDNLDMQVNALRMLVQNDQLIITPEAGIVAREMQVASWDNRGATWKRSEAHGHFNRLAAAIYLVRNIDRSFNPYPAIPDGMKRNTIWLSKKTEESRGKEAFVNAFRRK